MSARVLSHAREASRLYRMPVPVILGRDRHARVCAARRYVMRELRADGFSLGQIGRWMGRHHTTVLHAVRQ